MKPNRDRTENAACVGYSVLDNGADIAVLFPAIPRIQDVSIEANASVIRIRAGVGDLLLTELNDRVRGALSGAGILLVGVDTLSRAVFERRIRA